MDEESTQKLLQAAPLLYRGSDNRDRPFGFYGFEISQGWFDIVYDLSIKLEKEIRKQPDLRVTCNISKYSFRNLIRHVNWIREYTIYLFLIMFRVIYNYVYYPIRKGHTIKLFWNPPDRPRVNGELVDGFIYEAEDIRLKAAQVKSKFGSLRYYTDGIETRKIRKLIDQAESKSYKICEQCGKDGKTRSGGWIETLCDGCFNTRENNKLMRDILR